VRPEYLTSGGLVDEEFGATAGDEDAGVHGYPETAELRPAENVLERQASRPPVHHRSEFGRCPGGGEEQLRLVFGEDTASGAKSADDNGPSKS
jgi:hypothetical protein